MNNRIVIIGGLGPQASVGLHQKILDKSLRFHSGLSHEFPNIVHLSLPIPEFVSNQENNSKAIQHINRALAELRLENNLVCIACNTAHLLVPELKMKNGRLISMIDVVTQQLVENNFTKVGLLASPQTIKSGLYSTPLRKLGIDVLLPDSKQKHELEKIILAVIGGEINDGLKHRLNKLASSLVKRGAQAIILGCTELPLLGIDNVGAQEIDSLDALAIKLTEKYYGKR